MLLIIIVLVINGCLKTQKTAVAEGLQPRTSPKSRANPTSQVSKPLFTALSGAAGKSALDVEVQVDQLRVEGAETRLARQRR